MHRIIMNFTTNRFVWPSSPLTMKAISIFILGFACSWIRFVVVRSSMYLIPNYPLYVVLIWEDLRRNSKNLYCNANVHHMTLIHKTVLLSTPFSTKHFLTNYGSKFLFLNVRWKSCLCNHHSFRKKNIETWYAQSLQCTGMNISLVSIPFLCNTLCNHQPLNQEKWKIGASDDLDAILRASSLGIYVPLHVLGLHGEMLVWDRSCETLVLSSNPLHTRRIICYDFKLFWSSGAIYPCVLPWYCGWSEIIMPWISTKIVSNVIVSISE